MFQQGIEVRARIDDPASDRFPIVDDLRAEGVTDYIALPLPFIDGSVNASSWTTKQPGGFTDDQLAALRRIVTPLARVIEIITLTRTASEPARHLCRQPRRRAHPRRPDRRGHTETMNAAIWLSDLRGFTALSDRLPAETVVDILNQYFDCQVAAIRKHGGEVLKYMGDGLLAVFPIDEYVGDEQQVCSRVLEAAHESRASVADLQYPIGDAVERFRFGSRCMSGRYLFGNIGGGNRLDFTCIGPAVNLAAARTVTDSTTGTPASVVQNYTLQVATPTLSLTPAAGALTPTTAGSAYQVAFAAGGGVAPYTFAITTGTLPAGLALDAASGRLSGTPTAVGTVAFSVTATDSTTGTPATVTQAYTLSVAAPVLTLTPSTLPAGLFANAYQQQLSTSGGTAPYTYAVTTGALPGGLALAASGALTGTPTAAGAFAFTVTATDALGFTGTRDYTVQVTQRPDPTRDPEVRGLLSAQADTARRFATSQIENFQQRMQRLHGASRSNGFSNNLGLAYGPQRCDPAVGSLPGSDCDAQRRQPFDREPGLDAPAATGTGAQAALGLWVGGTIRTGRTNGRGSAGGDFNTDGVTLGSDLQVGEDLALGVGLGYGRDRTDVGENGSRSDGQAFTLAVYGSYSPGQHLFVDALLGHQLLDYDLRRYVTSDGSFVHARRDGSQWFGSLSVGADLVRGSWQFTPYARLDASRGTLDRYVEQGSDLFALRYGDQDVDTSTGNAGLRIETRKTAAWGAWTPQLRVEYQYDFSGSGTATMQYADLAGVPFYRTSLDGFDRNRWMLGAGVMFDFGRDWGLRVDYRGLVGSGEDRDHGVQISLDKQL